MAAAVPDTGLPRAVIGGGAAGLAAAEALAGEGQPVILFERRSRLGGRAGSFSDPVRGGLTDNQHIWMGCCTALRGLLERSGALGMVHEQERVRVPFATRVPPETGTRVRPAVLEAGFLPPPFHLLPTLLRFPLLTVGERFSLVRALMRLRHEGAFWQRTGAERSFGEWLDLTGQSAAIRETFWTPVVTSALNARPEDVRADLAAMVFTRAFLGGRRAAALGFSAVPLADLWERVAGRITSLGGRVSRREPVRAIEIGSDGRVTAVVTGTERIAVSGAVLAVPPGPLQALLPPEWREREPFARGRNLAWAPILNCHLWYAEPVTDEPFLAVTGSHVHWIFVRPPTGGWSGRDQHLNLVTSASQAWLDRSPEETCTALRNELADFLPATRTTPLLAWKVVHMRRATFAPRPGSERHRPRAETPISNLVLAGAWTATGWPSTLEGAVRSGELAARLLAVSPD